MSFKVVDARWLSDDVKRLEIQAPRVASHWLPGQFVIIRVDDNGERIPLTVCDVDTEKGTIVLIVQGIGKTTQMLNSKEAGEEIADVVGPLGHASEIEKFGTVVVIGGGVGTAIAYPTAKALADAGNKVIAVIGARTADLLILVDEMRRDVGEVVVVTDDGTAGKPGLVTDALAEIMGEEKVDRVIAIGPIPMMRAVAELTRSDAIPTWVSLNPIMVDGTGMCGGCRVKIGEETRFACVDGPEFDAHLVDFNVLAMRNRAYADFEKCRLQSLEK